MIIELSDVIDYIDNDASNKDLLQIESALNSRDRPLINFSNFKSNEGSFNNSEKLDLLILAFKKYTLVELEEKLGKL